MKLENGTYENDTHVEIYPMPLFCEKRWPAISFDQLRMDCATQGEGWLPGLGTLQPARRNFSEGWELLTGRVCSKN